MFSAHTVASRSALIAAVATAFGAATVAAELPTDANQIESLTPEQARKLAKEFPGVEVEIEIKGYGKQKVPACLPMNGLKSLDAKTAKALAGYDKGPLLFDGLTTLDANTAKALAEFKGERLYLNGLTTLDAEAAKALASSKAWNGQLPRLTTLSPATAKALAERGNCLVLDGLTRLDVDTAKAIAQFKALVLPLNGLTTLDADTAKALAEFEGRFLVLNGLTTLEAATAKALAEFKGYLSLTGLTTLDAEAAKALAANDKWTGYLSAVTALDSPDSVAIVKALATRKGPLSLPNLKKISPKTLSALIEKEDVEIPLIETLELIQEPDGSVTEDFIVPQWLSMRESRVKKEKRPN